MKIDVYVDLYNRDVTNNIKALIEDYILFQTKPHILCDEMDRLKVTINLPDKYFSHKIDGYGTVENIKKVDENERD